MSNDSAAKKYDGRLNATISGTIERKEGNWYYPAINISVAPSELNCEDSAGRMVSFSVSFHRLLVEFAPEETSRVRLKGEFLPLPDKRRKGKWVIQNIQHAMGAGEMIVGIRTQDLRDAVKMDGKGSFSALTAQKKQSELRDELTDPQVMVYHEDPSTIRLDISSNNPPLHCSFGLPNDALSWRVKEERRGNYPCRLELRMLAPARDLQFDNIKLPDHRPWERLTANKQKLAQAVFQEILRLRTGEEQEIDQRRRPHSTILIHRQFLELKNDNTE